MWNSNPGDRTTAPQATFMKLKERRLSDILTVNEAVPH